MSEKNEKQRVICTKCGYAEFQTILRPMVSKEIRVMAVLVCCGEKPISEHKK